MGKTADELNSYNPLDDNEHDMDITPAVARMDDAGNDDRNGDDDSNEEVEEIRADIEQTRAEMTETINAIQERLSPQHLMEQAKDTVREATIGRMEHMVSNVGDKIGEVAEQTTYEVTEQAGGVLRLVRENPVPAAIAGLGLGWLFMKGRDSDQRRRGTVSPTRIYPRYDSYPPYSGGRYGGSSTRNERSPGDTTGEAFGEARERVEEIAGEAADRAGQVVGQAQDKAGDLFSTIKQNPIPAAMAGLGLWLLFNGGNNSSQRQNRYPYRGYGGYLDHSGSSGYQGRDYQGQSSGSGRSVGDTISDARDKMGDVASDAREKVGDVAGEAREKVGEVAEQVGDTVGQVASQVGSTAGHVANTAGDTAGDVFGMIRRNPVPAALAGLSIAWLVMNREDGSRGDHMLYQARHAVGDTFGSAGEKVADVTGSAQERVGTMAGQAQGQFQQTLWDNPLVVGATALALGAAIGLAVPETPQEHQLMGQVRDNLLDRAQGVAQDTIQRVQHVAGRVTEEAQRTAQAEAENQGLTQTGSSAD